MKSLFLFACLAVGSFPSNANLNTREICESKNESIQNFVRALKLRGQHDKSCEDKMQLFLQGEEALLIQEDGQVDQNLDLSPLTIHGGLKTIIIYGKYRIRNLDALGFHKTLEDLRINEALSIEPYLDKKFSFAPSVKSLGIRNVARVSAELLGHIHPGTSLDYLTVSVGGIMPLLPEQTKLKSLSIYGTSSDISASLGDLQAKNGSSIIQLNCEKDEESALDLSPLSGTSVERVWLSSCPSVDTESLLRLSQIKELRWSSLKIKSLDVFAKLKNLESLDLGDSKNLKNLHGISGLTNLKTLSLGWTGIDDDSLQGLSGLTNLTKLNLNNNEIKGYGLKYLASLTNVNELDLDQTMIGDEGLKYFKFWPSTSALKHLRIFKQHGEPLTGKTIDSLAHLPISELQICYNNIDDEGLFKLAKALPNLTWLPLRGNRYSDKGLEALKDLKSLKSLRLDENEHITRNGVEALVLLPDLNYISVESTKITKNDAKELVAKSCNPKLKIGSMSHIQGFSEDL